MVRLKTAYWEFDFEAVCPTLDHNLLSQAHIYIQHTVVHAQTKPLSYNTQLYMHRQSHFHTTHSCTCTDKATFIQHTVVHAQTKPLSYNTQLYTHKATYIQYMNKDGHRNTTIYKTTHIFLVKVIGIFKNLISWGQRAWE